MVMRHQYQWQERTLNFVIVAWVVEVDAELLHRFIVRYGDAIGRILKDPDNWSGYLSSPVVGTTSYSDIYTVEHGLSQGCSIEGTIEFFI